MTLLSALLFFLSSFTACFRLPRHHRRARFRFREHRVIDAALHWVFVVAEPLLPLITCCFLGAGVSAAVAVEQHPGNTDVRLDQNGTLVNASSARRWPFHLYESQSSPALVHRSAAFPFHSSFSSSSSSSPGPSCQLLTTESVDQLCADFVARRLKSLSSPRAARRLRFCDMFDYRKLLVFASSLTNGSTDCSSLLLMGERRPNKTTCVLCLTALLERDLQAREGAEEHVRVLDKVQCNSWKLSPSPPSSMFSSSILSYLTTSSPFGVSPSPSSSSSSPSPPTDNEPERRGDTLTEVPMTPQTHAGSSDCSECKKVYKGWLCTAMFDEVRPFAAHEHLPKEQRLLKVPACDSWCAGVETECPYFTPDEEQQNGGEPLFLCREAHYHDSPRYPMSTSSCRSGSHRHLCCYTPDDLYCLISNSTCASLEDVCLLPRPPGNASSLPPTTSQQQQYSGVLEANVTTNLTLSSSAGRTGDYGALSRLLLLLLVAYCCSELT